MVAASNGISVTEEAEETSRLHAAHFAEGRLYRSVLNLINAYHGEAWVAIRTFTEGGSLPAESVPIVLPAGGMTEGDLRAWGWTGSRPTSSAATSGWNRTASCPAATRPSAWA